MLSQLPFVQDDNVVVDYHQADDAAVVRLDGERAIVQTVDFFTPIVDDPYAFGQIAAANSLSDIYAMGARPLFALNIVAFPSTDLPLETLTEILKGGSDKAREAGIPIVGGHSIDDKEPKYGLVVTGEVATNRMIKNSTAQRGDVLILTKPLGTGIIATAIKGGQADAVLIETATNVMTQLNRLASELMIRYRAHAGTDITGYGLLGHLLEICQASGVSAELHYSQLQFMDGVEALAKKGIVPGGSQRNLKFVAPHVSFVANLRDHEKLMLADAQTSGGLLIALPTDAASKFLTSFNSQSEIKALRIGRTVEKRKHSILVK